MKLQETINFTTIRRSFIMEHYNLYERGQELSDFKKLARPVPT